MKYNACTPMIAGPIADFPLMRVQEFQAKILEDIASGYRLVTFFGSHGVGPDQVILNCVLAHDDRGLLTLLRSEANIQDEYHSLTPRIPQFHVFERECAELFGLNLRGHPWLKPIRYPSTSASKLGEYPFYQLDGKEVHEVGVGPIHAGVIEPGHFRFMCFGETVHHLEIQLGYQHRGIEALLLRSDPAKLAPLVEVVSGDSSIAHASAYCLAWEAVCGVTVPWNVQVVRGLALELERVAMHLAGLAGMCADIAFLPGAATYGRLRTGAINASMRLCGSRFGREWARPETMQFEWNREIRLEILAAIKILEADLGPINDLFLNSKTVRHRLRGVGKISKDTALEMGFVGMAARSVGLPLDLRTRFPNELQRRIPLWTATEDSGDCWARAILRIREVSASLKWINAAVGVMETFADHSRKARLSSSEWSVPDMKPAADTIVVALVEGWRGEVVHCIQTDANGRIAHYKVQDPSLRNWFSLALAVRGNEISDFPICNKSFDLSYCGQDL